MSREEYKDAIEVSVIFHEGQRMFAVPKQPAQPRAWFTVDEMNAWADKKLKENPQWAEQPAPVQQEPAFYGFMCEEECCVNICYTPSAPGGPNNELPTAYYTQPPQRKPLTDEEIKQFASKHLDVGDGSYATHFVTGDVAFARAIEAAHNIKENT